MTPVLLALAAAAAVAIGSALQHEAATDESAAAAGHRLMLRLVRKPRWSIGLVFSVAAFVLHGAALHHGRLGIVQPLLATSLIFALPLRAILDHHRVSRAELAAAAVLAASLAGFLIAARPTSGVAAADGAAAGVMLGVGATLVSVAAVLARRVRSANIAGVLLGAATGVLYGLVGGALKATVHQISVAPAQLLTTWPLWALLLAGAWALVLNQRAYTYAPLPTSLPALMVLNPVVGVVFGAYVFDEKPADDPLAVVAQVLCLAVVTAAIAELARRAQTPRQGSCAF